MPWPPRNFAPAQIDALFAAQRENDPLGHRLHTACAAVALAGISLPTTLAEWAMVPLCVCFLVRMISHHAILEPLWREPVAWLTLAFCALVGASVIWSVALEGPQTRARWVDDVGPLRFALMVPLLWPVLDRRAWLIAAILVGVGLAMASQALHALGLTLNLPALTWPRQPGRVSGWLDPVVAGSLLAAAAGMLLALTLGVRSARTCGLSALALALTLVAVLATGTRGAWIGCALALVAGLVVITAPIRPFRRVVAVWVLAGVLAVAAGAAGWFLAGDAVRQRFHTGVSEVSTALERDDYASDTGARIAMWKWAVRAVGHRPILGVGAGGYRPWVVRTIRAQSPTQTDDTLARTLPHRHAHSWFLHTAAITGLAGLLVLSALFAAALKSAVRAPARPRETALGLAPALGLLGLFGAGIFDTITVNQQTAALFWALVALSLASRPAAPQRTTS